MCVCLTYMYIYDIYIIYNNNNIMYNILYIF